MNMTEQETHQSLNSFVYLTIWYLLAFLEFTLDNGLSGGYLFGVLSDWQYIVA